MNRPIKNALLTLIMVIVLAATGHGAQPLPPSHEFLSQRCGVCHASSDSSTLAKNNVCLVCHKSGGISGTNKQFFIGDMANPFGTTIESGDNKSYTHSSHEWSATDDNPAAGALPPVTPVMNKFYVYNGYLSCNRCHGMHQTPYLPHITKQSMANDELCLDCHRLRNTGSHTYGTHPVNIDYNAATNGKLNKFAATPMNSNPGNTTSDLNKNLLNGKVMCSTCHRVHFSDSSSKTLDNFSTALVNGLMPSKGYLLRTDYRYVNYTTHNSPNICTNCHTGKHEHNGGGQRVLCTDCHSAHVDYDQNATDAASLVPNVYMVKRYMNWSSPTGWKDNKTIPKQTLFQDASEAKLYKRADGKGVCQSCHDVPAGGTIAPSGKPYPDAHDQVNATASACNTCHNHEGEWSFGSSCNRCHGQPPTATTAAAGYAGNEAISGHGKHANSYTYKCLECHYNAPPDSLHNKGTFQDVYHRPEYVDAGTIASKYGSHPVYNAPSNTCSNVYCHSNGVAAALVWKDTPSWLGGGTDCNSCHEAAPTTNAHGAHLAKGYVCENCHAATATGSSSIANKPNHADGNIQLQFASVSRPFALSGNSCATIYCHSDGSGNYSNPDWKVPSTGQCGSCHDTITRSSGAHQAHISITNAYGPKLAQYPTVAVCNTCHGPDYTTKHLNGTTLDVVASTCSASCHPHGDANGIGAGSWITGRTGITCESCHTGTLSSVNGATAPDKSLAATKGHNMNSSSTGVIINYNCTTCHDADSKHIDPAVHDKRLLSAYAGALNTECNACHNDTVKVPTESKSQMLTHITAYIGTAATANTAESACATCHDPHGTTNRNMIRAKIVAYDRVAFKNITCNISYKNTTSLVSNVKVGNLYTGLCQVCHTGTRFYNNFDPESSHYTADCFNCHKHKPVPGTPTYYAFQPSGGACSSCHGYPPVQTVQPSYGTLVNYSGARLENYSGGGGAHDVPGHVAITSRPADGWAKCDTCHYGANPVQPHMSGNLTKPRTINVQVNPKYKFDSKLPITYTGNKSDTRSEYYSGTCSNVSCHFQASPKWSSEK